MKCNYGGEKMNTIIKVITKFFTFTGNPIFDFIIVSFILTLAFIISFKVTGFSASALDYDSKKMSAFHWILRIILVVSISYVVMKYHVLTYTFLGLGSLLILYKFINKMKNLF